MEFLLHTLSLDALCIMSHFCILRHSWDTLATGTLLTGAICLLGHCLLKHSAYWDTLLTGILCLLEYFAYWDTAHWDNLFTERLLPGTICLLGQSVSTAICPGKLCSDVDKREKPTQYARTNNAGLCTVSGNPS